MLGRMKEGIRKSRPCVFVPRSRACISVLEFLYKGGYILGYCLHGSNMLRVDFKYLKSRPYIRSLEVYTKPSRIVYYSYASLQRELSRTSVVVLSTYKGLQYSNEIVDLFVREARNNNRIGGTMLFGIKV